MLLCLTLAVWYCRCCRRRCGWFPSLLLLKRLIAVADVVGCGGDVRPSMATSSALALPMLALPMMFPLSPPLSLMLQSSMVLRSSLPVLVLLARLMSVADAMLLVRTHVQLVVAPDCSGVRAANRARAAACGCRCRHVCRRCRCDVEFWHVVCGADGAVLVIVATVAAAVVASSVGGGVVAAAVDAAGAAVLVAVALLSVSSRPSPLVWLRFSLSVVGPAAAVVVVAEASVSSILFSVVAARLERWGRCCRRRCDHCRRRRRRRIGANTLVISKSLNRAHPLRPNMVNQTRRNNALNAVFVRLAKCPTKPRPCLCQSPTWFSVIVFGPLP